MHNTSKAHLSYLTKVYRQVNNMIKTESKGSNLINHSLEEGLSNEEIIRVTLRRILPKHYGVGKGKVANTIGTMSKQVDIIIYDALNCPNLFVDDNMNQVLPIEGVYAIIEVKTHLNSSKMRESFEQIHSVKTLLDGKNDVSTNDLIQIIPPLGYVVTFRDERSLEGIYKNYVALNKEWEVPFSSLSYSKKSPGYANHSGQYFLVEDIVVIDKGTIHYMYDGVPVLYPTGADSMGCFIVHLLEHMQEMNLPVPSLLNYYGLTTIFYEQKTKTKDGFTTLNPAFPPP